MGAIKMPSVLSYDNHRLASIEMDFQDTNFFVVPQNTHTVSSELLVVNDKDTQKLAPHNQLLLTRQTCMIA